MNCSKYKERMSEYVDGELNEHERQDMDKHLLFCPECKVLSDELQSIQLTFREAIDCLPVPDGLNEKLLARVQAERVNSRIQVFLTSLILFLLGSPVLLIFSPFVSAMLHWLHTAYTAFWHTVFALVKIISPLTSIGIGFASIILIGMGTFFIKALLQEVQLNEVFS